MQNGAELFDLAVIGAGAAGLMAAVQAGRSRGSKRRRLRIVALDGASAIGKKILIAGGGRCNVTHDVVDESAFAGSTPASIRRVLVRFGVDDTVRFFADLGVALKRESTGKLFPVTDRARSVLDALVGAADDAGVEIRCGWRVLSVSPGRELFTIRGPKGTLGARRIVLTTGGRSLPKSGSDGHGLEIARRLGHTTTTRIVPALVPLLLADGSFVRSLSGVAAEAVLTVRTAEGKRVVSMSGSVLCTHFGLSGPVALDISRHWIHARLDDPGASLRVDWLPQLGASGLREEFLRRSGTPVGSVLRRHLPDRLAQALCAEAGVDRAVPFERVSREARDRLVRTAGDCALPVVGDRGFTHAEVTAGGVPLAEMRLPTLESRPCPGAHLAGEILDVDGRIGGYNFQWAWASGFVAGIAAARALTEPTA